MILAVIIAWTLLTACGEYLLRQASFLDGVRGDIVRRWPWFGRMILCFACPWGWASVPAGIVVALTIFVWTLNPWSVVPLIAVLLPAFGLGLARLVALLSFGVQAFKKGG